MHAGSFMRRREIVLEKDLLESPAELARVLVHELFHFVWVRAGNTVRRSWEALIAEELERHARGELGWSAEMRKRALGRRDAALRTRRWREYLCESFCDTAAWILSHARRHEEFTLAAGNRRRRREWFRAVMLRPEISI